MKEKLCPICGLEHKKYDEVKNCIKIVNAYKHQISNNLLNNRLDKFKGLNKELQNRIKYFDDYLKFKGWD